MSLSASVSNIELFRTWKDEEELDLAWLLRKIRGEEPQSDAMLAGCAFHDAIERVGEGELVAITSGDYRFDFDCSCEVALPKVRETSIEKMYGGLLVCGRVDALIGKEITDYKTTSQFDADRLMSGYQWRFYLDMMECDTFCWQVFVMKETNDPKQYLIRDVHTLRQARYPGLHQDCERLARDYVLALEDSLMPVHH